jgi:MoxR-like ATPase
MTAPESSAAEKKLEGGSYEVIRRRLLEQSAELSRRAQILNHRRQELFGGGELTLIATDRVRTVNNCVPRDVVSVDGHLLIGFQVFIGLKSETTVEDVFGLYRFERTADGFDLSGNPDGPACDFLRDPEFDKQLRDVFRYNKDARLLQLRRTEQRLLIVVQIGSTLRDVKVFRFAIDAKGRVSFMDARGEEDCVPPRAHSFEWTVCTRANQVSGAHPHVSILDQVFVETVGGDLTIKIENNTQTGLGIYSEPVEDKNQTLDDAEIAYAKVGWLILLRIKPFREEQHRYFIYNTRTEQVLRVDTLGQACVELPENHGIVFPGGYYLQTGEYRLFEGESRGLTYERSIRSPNGEDVLYVFYRSLEGAYELLPYNLVKKEISTPIRCSGYSLFDDGTMLVFRSSPSEEPTRVHPVQIWKTPFVTAEFAASAPTDGSYLAKVGNADLVAAISEILSLCRLASHEQPTRRTFEDVVQSVTRLSGTHYWLGHAEAEGIGEWLKTVRESTELVVGEFEKALLVEKRARETLAQIETDHRDLLVRIRAPELRHVDAFLSALTELRRHRGKLVSLKEMRAINLDRVSELEAELVTRFDEVSRACVAFFLADDAFAPLLARIDGLVAKTEAVDKSVELVPLAQELTSIQEGLTLLTETVSGLKIDDPTSRTRILDGASSAFSQQNRARAIFDAKQRSLAASEGRAEFAVQFKLLSQSVTASLALATTPDACDKQLSQLMVAFEELEGRFGMLEEFSTELTAKREEVVDAISTRRQILVEERQRRARHLVTTAERIMTGVLRRAKTLKGADELNSYFVSDPMVLKLGELRDKLRELEQTVQADEIESKLASAKQTALRLLRDQTDLFEEGNVIRFGTHRFTVSELMLDLTIVPKDEALGFHLTGTDFYQTIDDARLNAAREFWDQDLVSENAEIYRGEFLAVSLLSSSGLVAAVREGKVAEFVRNAALSRLDEGYEPGVHDHDAELILARLRAVSQTAGTLKYTPRARAMAWLFWHSLAPDHRDLLERRARSAGRLAVHLVDRRAQVALATEIEPQIQACCDSLRQTGLAASMRSAARALVDELAAERLEFSTSHRAAELENLLFSQLEECGARRDFEEDLRSLDAHLPERLALCLDYLDSWFERNPSGDALRSYREEAAVRLCLGQTLPLRQVTSDTRASIPDLLGNHPRIAGRTLTFGVDEILERVQRYVEYQAPRYRDYRKLRVELAERERSALRLGEFMPKVLTSFVRNRLIDEVYLPLVGANLAKQLGAAGSAKRTDLMGLLLLVSPPGYGKTTLMEYVASRLGLIFMKVNGPALGTEVRSLDPSEAPNATAAQEVEKINLSLEMGNNVMLYLDDIQHTHPELLQKFISLCDAQRRIEGVWRGRTRTYDLRGKRFCIVMAGNPYTESGARFQIPDMLANRADTYNLGDILDGKEEAFALSYLENALTSNRQLAPLAAREAADVYKLIQMAQGKEVAESDLSHGYSPTEIDEYVSLFRHLLQIQRTLLKVNLEYIASASKEDQYRTEPPFKLQGSYRNMNKLAEKVVSAMNTDEIERLIDDHYAGESQTLTSSAEQNLLKLAELRGRLSDAQACRWKEIKEGYCRVQRMGGKDDDPVARVTGTLSGLDVQLGGIRETLGAAVHKFEVEREEARKKGDTATAPAWLDSIKQAVETLARPKVEVALRNPVESDLMTLLGQHMNQLGVALARATAARDHAGSAANAGQRALPAARTTGSDGGVDGAAGAVVGTLDAKLNDVLAAVHGMSQLLTDSQNAVWREDVELTGESASYFFSDLGGKDVVNEGGLFVATWNKPPNVGDVVELGLRGIGRHVTVRGVVVFVKSTTESETPPGYGVRFLRISEEARSFVSACVKQRQPLVY